MILKKIKTNNESLEPFLLKDVIYSPSLQGNLLALRHFTDEGYRVILDNKEVIILDPVTNEIFATGIYNEPYWTIDFQIYFSNLKVLLIIRN